MWAHTPKSDTDVWTFSDFVVLHPILGLETSTASNFCIVSDESRGACNHADVLNFPENISAYSLFEDKCGWQWSVLSMSIQQ